MCVHSSRLRRSQFPRVHAWDIYVCVCQVEVDGDGGIDIYATIWFVLIKELVRYTFTTHDID
jgi:hypothetical protein